MHHSDRAESAWENAQTSAAEVEHLIGRAVPKVALPATGRHEKVALGSPDRQVRLVTYAYPSIGSPDRPLITPDWMSIPGAFGCTTESCAFRDLNSMIRELGATVCGLSTQSPSEQAEAAKRLSLNFALVSDHELLLTNALGLPTWRAAGRLLLKRFTMIVRFGRIEHVFAPVRDVNTHALDVVEWLRTQLN